MAVVYSSPVVLTRYILREHAAPFCYALFVITFLFLVDFLIRILSSILSKGLEWRVVVEIIILNLAWMLALSIPMAVLVSSLMAFGRLSADNEITALRALGVSPLKAMIPVLFLAAFLSGGLMWFNDQVLPEANHRAAALRNDIGRKKPTALIAPKRLIRDFAGYQLWIDKVDDRTGKLYGVRILQQDPGRPVRITYADSGSMEYANSGRTLLVHLRNGENHSVDQRDPKSYGRIRFEAQTVAIENVDAALKRQERSYRTDREMSVQDMGKIVEGSRQRLEQLRSEHALKIFDDIKALDIALASDSGKALPPRIRDTPWRRQTEIGPSIFVAARKQSAEKLYQIERYANRAQNERREINQYMVEIHKKFAIPVACLVFVLVGGPLGVMARRGGIGTGVIYSLFFFVAYWASMIRGEALADRLIVSPLVAMWGPNVLVGLCGILLVWRMAREKYAPSRPWLERLRFVWRRKFRKADPA